MDENTRNGLKKIYEVLGYTTDNKMRIRMIVWARDSVAALLRGESVQDPPRVSDLEPQE